MEIKELCQSYFSMPEFSEFKKMSVREKVATVVKGFSYALIFPPLIMGFVYGLSSLFGRAKKIEIPSATDKKVENQASQAGITDPSKTETEKGGEGKGEFKMPSVTESESQDPDKLNLVAVNESLRVGKFDQARRIAENFSKENRDKALKQIDALDPSRKSDVASEPKPAELKVQDRFDVAISEAQAIPDEYVRGLKLQQLAKGLAQLKKIDRADKVAESIPDKALRDVTKRQIAEIKERRIV